MRVFVAGATGAIGRRLVPALLATGHQVIALTRNPTRAEPLRAAGAGIVIADALDRDALIREMVGARPDAVIHQLTALDGVTNFRDFDAAFAPTNRLRIEGTDNLVAAARAAGASRLIAQSYGGWIYRPAGSALKSESDPLDPEPPATQRGTLAAIRHLEEAVLGAADLEGIVLRYGSFYGPGTAIAHDGDVARLIRRRALPVVGGGAGVWSFIHVDDAAAATVAALEHGTRGTYNIADDDPAPVAEWVPELARVLGAKPPRRVPLWLGRLAAGEAAASMMTRVHGMSNAKARRELGWAPRYRSWREGFRSGLAEQPAGPPAEVRG